MEWLGVETYAGRLPRRRVHRVADFPMLRDQVRTATGYTIAAGGVVRMPAGTAVMPPSAIASPGKPVEDPRLAPTEGLRPLGGTNLQVMLELLRVADAGVALPSTRALGEVIGQTVYSARDALKGLAKAGWIVMDVDRRVSVDREPARTIQLRCGTMLTSAAAQAAKAGPVVAAPAQAAPDGLPPPAGAKRLVGVRRQMLRLLVGKADLGEALPNTRALGVALDVTDTDVLAALASLQAEGWLDTAAARRVGGERYAGRAVRLRCGRVLRTANAPAELLAVSAGLDRPPATGCAA